jgi:hypothetical protein
MLEGGNEMDKDGVVMLDLVERDMCVYFEVVEARGRLYVEVKNDWCRVIRSSAYESASGRCIF